MKKILALILSTVLLLSVGAPFSAAEYTEDSFIFLKSRASFVYALYEVLDGNNDPVLKDAMDALIAAEPDTSGGKDAYMRCLDQIETVENLVYTKLGMNEGILTVIDPLKEMKSYRQAVADNAEQIGQAAADYLVNATDVYIQAYELDDHVTVGKTVYFYYIFTYSLLLFEANACPQEFFKKMCDEIPATCALITLPENRAAEEYIRYAACLDTAREILQTGIDSLDETTAQFVSDYMDAHMTLISSIMFGKTAQIELAMMLHEKIGSSELDYWDISLSSSASVKDIYDWIMQADSLTDAQSADYMDRLQTLLQDAKIQCNPWGKYGDVDNDEQIRLTDVISLAKIVLNGSQQDADTIKRADLTNDGKLNLPDVIHLAKCVLGSAGIADNL